MLKLSDFDYHLPAELIAQYPLKERAEAKLLVLNRKPGTIEHRTFKDIPEYIRKNDLLVLNDTRVLACRLKGKRRTGGKVELLLLRQKEGLVFDCLVRPARIRLGERLYFNNNKLSCELTAKNEVRFDAQNINEVYKSGQVPLPPYIKRDPEDLDSVYYQTVYAKNNGSIASPTAGLHFSEELLNKIRLGGVNTAYITLHISYSTFKPVKSEYITEHKMEKESFQISPEAVKAINHIRSQGGQIFAVGTTSCRALESFAANKTDGETDLFIYPGFKFNLVDCLLTNFHLPRTTLFMLTCAFAGLDMVKKAYQEAVDRKYRFYSYGDAMLIL
ncbi:MAG: tRNA preQ1(34) S-adenosylmethionine ribosyltransferase-isomerase QueA [Candidatus Omnitrophota bacterium]|nr:tRNA preQ1(34) S-adenosylmethionine ribosyltransferase-isomerase QueA [Candidatus Omnitrophota bacterium]MBU2034502.1 tRNA preQ1(34) S-adenosylmethionine ribosyltransferase-isomerase QueA [Candidatus Omnitrophota bacterium]MBU2221132.1 tRNA preQ1(34) S-adenosylmethionine ribosyltransferase-isomerase QueA [Candidatus Omnitrophota bacterium]MBU2258600.1 tRNA preQ1(34) S-adenosylmethionine ribosyltransferase-isomerase QueA [Candidatus Omnitrophota bacterium]